LVSAHAFGGVPQRAISAVLEEAEPYVSEALLEEYRDVGPRLFADGKLQQEQLESLVTGIAASRPSPAWWSRGRRSRSAEIPKTTWY
jgi:hypothetical protein